MDLYRQHDHEEVKEMSVGPFTATHLQSTELTYCRLRALVRNVEDLQVAVGMRDDVPALMETIQVVRPTRSMLLLCFTNLSVGTWG